MDESLDLCLLLCIDIIVSRIRLAFFPKGILSKPHPHLSLSFSLFSLSPLPPHTHTKSCIRVLKYISAHTSAVGRGLLACWIQTRIPGYNELNRSHTTHTLTRPLFQHGMREHKVLEVRAIVYKVLVYYIIYISGLFPGAFHHKGILFPDFRVNPLKVTLSDSVR